MDTGPSRRAFRRTSLPGACALAALLLCALLLLPSAGCGTGSDRAQSGGVAVAAGSAGAGSTAAASGGSTLMLGVMVHVEGWRGEERNQAVFQQHSGIIREYAAIFERYGLPLTFEFSPEFVKGCEAWGDNVVKELADRGHGIGVHADLGAEPGLTQQRFTAGLVDQKREIESLGVRVRHVSGICSSLDWVRAARDAGFLFVTGTVEYALKSIPADRLPEQYRSVLSINNPAQAHGSVPYELAERLHPWRMGSGATWLWDDPQGAVVIIPGDGGMCVTGMAEAAAGTDKQRGASLDPADVSAFAAEVDRALALCDADRTNALYVGWSVGARSDPASVEAWAQAIRRYVDSGKVEWKTLPAMYDSFIAREGAR